MKRRKEQKALMMLQLLVVAVIIGTLVFTFIHKGKEKESELIKAEDSHLGQSSSSGIKNSHAAESGTTISTGNTATLPSSTAFDPNTADSVTLVSVGLSPRQAQNVIKYRRKGGQYHRPEDFKRLYGLTVGQWEHIEPLIRIGREYQYLSDNEDVYARKSQRDRNTQGGAYTNGKSDNAAYTQDSVQHPRTTSPFYSENHIPKLKAGDQVDLATADTIALQHIPGIGPYYARRIHEYGERLGGFVSVNQLNDEALDFLPVGIEQYITLNKVSVTKLRINKLTTRELNRHPYLNYAQAKQITERVRLYGPFKTWQELLFLSEFSEKDRARLEPYISFE